MHSMELKQNVTGAWFLCPVCGSHCRHSDCGRTLAERYRFHVTVWYYLEMLTINVIVSVLLLPAIMWGAGGKPDRNVCMCLSAARLQGRESITSLCSWWLAWGGLTSDKPQRWEELGSGINIICKQLSSYCSFRAVLRSKGSLQSVISPITIKIY